LEEVPEVLDPVEVDARPSDQIERAMLADPSGVAIDERESLAQGSGRRRGGDDEEGFLGTGLVRTPVEDELTVAAGECPQLQPPTLTREECVVLNDLDRPLVGERRDPGRQGVDALDARLDLDVAWHRWSARGPGLRGAGCAVHAFTAR